MKTLFRGGVAVAACAVASLTPWSVASSASGGAQAPAGNQLANTRYASTASTDTTGSCTQTAPCRIDHAIADAAPGDRVIVEPGEYHVTSTLRATVAIDLEGEAGQPFPHLVGDPSLADATLDLADGSVRRLYVETAAPDGVALSLRGGIGEELTLVAAGGEHEGGAVTVKSSPGGTILRDSVARVIGTEGEVVELADGAPAGSVTLINATVIGGPDTTGIESKVAAGATLQNTIVRGGASDLKVASGTLSASYSSFRPTLSHAYTDAGHNQEAAPLFVDAAGGDYHELVSS
jgi:hypothetical protein